MRFLILESVSGLEERINPRLFPEGFAMLRTLVNEFKEGGFEVVTTLNRKLKRFEGWLNADVIFRQDELNRAIKSEPDAALIIAPEEDLDRITGRIKRNGISVLGAAESSIRAARDKWTSHNILKGKVPQPETWEAPPGGERPLIVKPKQGVGCEGVQFASPKSHADREGVIFQEPVQGTHASACLLMKDGEGCVLSVNEQDIEIEDGSFEYRGGRIPLRDGREGRCAEVALEAAKGLSLDGYCGVDLVIEDFPYFMELNPRVTTSFVGLAPILRANLGELIVNTFTEGIPQTIPELDGRSVIRMPKLRRSAEINTDNLKGLEQIPEVVSPPFTPDGYLERGSTIFLAVGWGDSFEEIDNEINGKISEALTSLGVDEDAVAWA